MLLILMSLIVSQPSFAQHCGYTPPAAQSARSEQTSVTEHELRDKFAAVIDKIKDEDLKQDALEALEAHEILAMDKVPGDAPVYLDAKGSTLMVVLEKLESPETGSYIPKAIGDMIENQFEMTDGLSHEAVREIVAANDAAFPKKAKYQGCQ